MLNNIINVFVFNIADIASLMNIEMMQYLVNIVPDNGYAVTDLAVLLGMIFFRAGTLCIVQVNGGLLSCILVNNTLYTINPNLISQICLIFLD